MTKKHPRMTPAEVIHRLEADGWTPRPGKGDHVNFKKPGEPRMVTVDAGAREIPVGTLRNIFRAAGWKW